MFDFSSLNGDGILIFLLMVPIEIIFHEAGHYLAAKHYHCYERFDVAFRNKPYLAAVFTDGNESIIQNLVITCAGVLTGIGFAICTQPINFYWDKLVLFSIVVSYHDIISSFLWFQWGKVNGFDRPMWQSPRIIWRTKYGAIEIYEADDYPIPEEFMM